jgi:hypothetical protein
VPPSATSPRRLIASQRRLRALDLRREGKTYREIGEQLGVSGQRAHRVVTEELLVQPG